VDVTGYRRFSGVRLADQGSFEERLVAALRDFEDLFAAQPAILLSSVTLILMGAWLQINIKKKIRVRIRQRLLLEPWW
jgi:hypothetical protein